jgi:Ca-activated chloride channel homolog
MTASVTRLLIALLVSSGLVPFVNAAQQPDQQVFRAGVDLVSVAVVVRDRQGRVVPSLRREDFTVRDGGQPRAIVDFHADAGAPIGVALLIDASGSMPRDTHVARRIGHRLLDQLADGRDDAALLTFDTRLLVQRAFTTDIAAVRSGLFAIDPFGASSIYDAIAGAAGRVADGTRKRRALVVVTDGADNASTYAPEEVAWIASTIDVPVYVLAVNGSPSDGSEKQVSRRSTLAQLAEGTGGDFFLTDSATGQQMAIGRIIEDLRHQYVIAFEPSSDPGLHRLEFETSNRTWKTRARRWYSAGTTD